MAQLRGVLTSRLHLGGRVRELGPCPVVTDGRRHSPKRTSVHSRASLLGGFELTRLRSSYAAYRASADPPSAGSVCVIASWRVLAPAGAAGTEPEVSTLSTQSGFWSYMTSSTSS